MEFKHITSIKELKLKANAIRQSIVKMLPLAGSGHTAGPLGMADIFAALYFGVLKHDPKMPDWEERDRVLLSNGHICPVLYSTLAEVGYFSKDELGGLRKFGSGLQGHPHLGSLPGIETSSGPLGQGLSQACGMALAAKLDGKKHIMFCLTSDGEHQEGQTWEAVLFAAKYRLGNIVQIMDRNFIQIDGTTEEVMPLEPLAEKYRAFNWNVVEMEGNNMQTVLDEIKNARKNAANGADKPTILIARTIPGKGVSFAENNYKWHGRPLNAEESLRALAELEEERKKIEME